MNAESIHKMATVAIDIGVIVLVGVTVLAILTFVTSVVVCIAHDIYCWPRNKNKKP